MGNKLMMKLVVGTETMFFLCLIVAYIYFSFRPGFSAQQEGKLNLQHTAIFSAMLFFSSFTFWRAEKNFNKGSIGRFKIWIIATLALGFIFLCGQGSEYLQLLQQRVTIGSGSFGTVFFTLTGFHVLHVIAGLILIGTVTLLCFLGDYDQKRSGIVSTIGIYWHFVDIVWAAVFFIIYLLPII